MDNSACCSIPVPKHLHYVLGPYSKSVCVIFRYIAPHSFQVHFLYTDDLDISVLCSPDNSIFKIPAGHTATVEIEEVAIGAAAEDQGRFIFSVVLHPTRLVKTMGKPDRKTTATLATLEDTLPGGLCAGSGKCAQSQPIPCKLNQEPDCNTSNMLYCRDKEPGGGGGGWARKPGKKSSKGK